MLNRLDVLRFFKAIRDEIWKIHFGPEWFKSTTISVFLLVMHFTNRRSILFRGILESGLWLPLTLHTFTPINLILPSFKITNSYWDYYSNWIKIFDLMTNYWTINVFQFRNSGWKSFIIKYVAENCNYPIVNLPHKMVGWASDARICPYHSLSKLVSPRLIKWVKYFFCLTFK